MRFDIFGKSPTIQNLLEHNCQPNPEIQIIIVYIWSEREAALSSVKRISYINCFLETRTLNLSEGRIADKSIANEVICLVLRPFFFYFRPFIVHFTRRTRIYVRNNIWCNQCTNDKQKLMIKGTKLLTRELLRKMTSKMWYSLEDCP